MLSFTPAYRSLWVIKAPGEKADNLGPDWIRMSAAWAVQTTRGLLECVTGKEGVNAWVYWPQHKKKKKKKKKKNRKKTILLCYACLAWLVSVCYALASFTLWRLAASAHNVSLCRVRQQEDVRRASDREGATEERIRSENGGEELQKNLAGGARGKVAKLNT